MAERIGITDASVYGEIGEKVREAIGATEKYAPSQLPVKVAEAIQYNRELGYVSGKTDGVTEGIEQGKQDERTAFWDAYQTNGTRIDYSRAFGGHGWTADNFKPRYDMIVNRCDNMFNYARGLNIDLAEHLEQLGVVLDTSNAANLSSMFEWSRVKRIGTINLSSATSATALCNNASSLHTIDGLVFPSNKAVALPSAFTGCTALKNLTIEGTILHTLDFRDCPLTRASIESIMAHTSTTTTLTLTFKKAAVNSAFETSSGAADGSTSEEWLALVNAVPQATISLV